MSRDHRDQRGGHAKRPRGGRRSRNACGCCTGRETYERSDGATDKGGRGQRVRNSIRKQIAGSG